MQLVLSHPRISWRNSGWQWCSLGILFFVLAFSYVWDLSRNKFGNDFYAAAMQAGAHSWKAFFYGASDFQATITVDKPPLSLWPSSLAIRFFGLNSWSIFLPEVVMFLITAWTIYVLVRRNFSHLAAWLSVFAFASTPVVFVMFRFDNPDAMMLLWITLAVYTLDKAVEVFHGTRSWFLFWLWNVVTGLLMGLSFLTKQLEGLMTIPALVIGILVCIPGWKHKLITLIYNFVGLIIGAGWWTAIVELVPASERPFIGGSPTNDFLQLTFVYNGIDRFAGVVSKKFADVHFPRIGAAGDLDYKVHHLTPGISRFLWSFEATQIGLLTVLTLLGIILGFFWLYRWYQGSASQKLLYIVMSVWFISLWLTFSFMGRRFNSYYALILVIPMACICGCTLAVLWKMRNQWWVKKLTLLLIILETVTAVLTACNGDDLTPSYVPWTIGIIGIISVVVAVQMMWKTTYAYSTPARNPWIVTTAVGLFFLTFIPSLYYLTTTYSRSITSGTTVAGPGFKVYADPAYQDQIKQGNVLRHKVERYIIADAANYQWIAGIINSKSAMDPTLLQLDTGYSVMPIGGYFGFDPCPTFAQFKSIVQEHKMHYYIISEKYSKTSGKKQTAQKSTIIDKTVQPEIYKYVSQNFPYISISAYYSVEKITMIEKIYDLSKPIGGEVSSSV